jgi:hypothetical protein
MGSIDLAADLQRRGQQQVERAADRPSVEFSIGTTP